MVGEGKEKTLQRTYRLPAGDVELIELLAKNGMLGSNRSAVVRALVSKALRELTDSEYVRKYKEQVDLLKK